jgi:hypothetical protein
MATSVEKTLAERGTRYGEFRDHAFITQALKDVAHTSPGWKRLDPAMREGLEMVMHKIGRILNGDPTYADSWHDIAGYAKLVEDIVSGSVPAPRDAPGQPAPVAYEEQPAPLPPPLPYTPPARVEPIQLPLVDEPVAPPFATPQVPMVPPRVPSRPRE